QPMVVCARLIDYLDQGVYLLLRRAVVVQPLNTQRVEEYLIHAGEKYAPLRAALQIDPALQELAVSPLMLSTLALTYQDHMFNPPSEPLSLETRGKAVFANYVEHMLVRRKGTGHYTAKQTLCWLSWLARMLVQHQQTEFYIESMQPSWLSTPRAIRWYGCLLMGLLIGLLGGTMGMLADLPLYETIHKYLFETLTHSTISNWQCSESLPAFNTIQASIASVGSLPLVGLFYGIAFALLAGLISGLFSSSEIPLLPTRIFTWAGGIARYGFALLLGVAGGSAFILINLFWVPCPFSAGLYDQVAEELVYGLCGALMGGLVGGGLRDLISLRRYHIQPVEALVWTHLPIRRLLISVIMGGMIGLLIGAATELLGEVYLRFAHWQHALPFGVLMGGLLGAAAGAWIGGFSSHMLEKHSLVRPNEGIRRSARNGLLIAIPTGLTFSIFTFTLVLCFNTSNITDAILWSLPLGLFMIEILFLLNGGYAVLQHQVLRFLLYYQHSIPWNYARFLDEATEALLLRKVGGGYMFIHRLLLEYFASYEAETQKEQHMSKARLISRRRLVVKK
ncbi:MAG TPA: hypothetical protein VFN35_14185, partial [Ktedonobacteraceae bacterium]|nr:hypothetical protein [Ktedonobacteraceae bacterium]